jgi:dipeptidyl aminopeptidase/acylaminoacyl peptidase
LSGQELVVYQLASARGHTAVVAAADTVAPEIFALEAGKLRKLTSHNDALLSELQLGAVEDITFNSEDGTEVHGMIIKPPAYDSSRQYPTLLWIHGGPNMQDDRIEYIDAFGVAHWKTFCFSIAKNATIASCKSGNDEDDNPELPPN